MKGDEFVSWVTRATIWVEENSRTVVIGITSALLLIAVVVGAFAWFRSSREKAFARLGEVQKIADTPVGSPVEQPGSFSTAEERASRVVEAADRMLKDYGSGQPATWARYHRAAALLDLGRIDDASSSVEPLVNQASGTLLGDLSRLLAGRIEEARGNFQKAADLYGQAVAGASKSFPTELALFDQARCLSAAGKKDEAVSAYQKIVDLYAESPLAAKANQKIQEIRSPAQGM
jgi:tetratricopeptide (TPR) repeat protein